MGCCFLEENGLHHGDIRPFNIFLTYDNAHARICDNGLLNAIKSNYYKRLCGDIDVYLSPEQLEAFQNKEINPQFDVEKSDIYSLGMTLLHALTLESPLKTVYDRINPYILHSNVDDQLIVCKERYSFQLVDLLRQMLMQEPLQRLTFKEALAEIIQNNQQLNAQHQVYKSHKNEWPPIQTTYQHNPYPAAIENSYVKYSQPQVMFQQSPIIPQHQFVQPMIQQPQKFIKYPQQGMMYQNIPVQQAAPLNSSLMLARFQDNQPKLNSNYFYDEKEIDRRVQEAISKTEQTIRNNQKFQESYGPMIKLFSDFYNI
eukprot:TRINITY_DN7784_c0_g1_i1.p1 TRINITY_DN7784_c0_g1~~TRINITY_DN7784_c0_g1_i1.p1  ORF type:complete len:314 (-),score=27.43 TRINITY_DN7784_c0_g1_i1:355-1296(-)